ncbi:glutamate synthase subunit beta [Chlorobium phaeovibrioides]|uniref:Glutamate synthase small subunit n=2 Tax=Chlorobium phaeovibrioides TaxID=1094 RepID=A0A432AV03_CHLPH|nr:glutamate synthase subunit beta [Chlorobium phaeovibrioides]HCD36326.1 glutamate synthase subunit beta [Chlorobium sp.]KAA6232206.1 glutamate synthase subunit beta [Chlorobium phaeovibrioides]MWV54638.1 glutamate synthase small subunit [Chlorobium phaeovibrioides]QEQ57280.1 glutamate synthase subunit beta [Chlorobium phaeovibrioides]RTY34826.1 glutamate synthase subunit beta [Chlorobium phaeovibrioides]
MGKVKGFMEFQREVPADRAPLERIKDWKEFHLKMSDEALQSQGARCMDCGTPFCHTGIMLGGMTTGCPIHNLIPEWNDDVYRGFWRDAYDRLMKTNNFPEFTGRVCPAPCEGSCVLGIIEPPVTIKNIECDIIEHAFAEGFVVPKKIEHRTGKRVAVVGSGPAGLACADQLNKAGHSVTVFERDDRCGGLLMYGIPNMKLDKQAVVQRRIDIMEEEGVVFMPNTEVGSSSCPAEKLLEDFDAAVLCTGSTVPRDLDAEGRRESGGIHFAMDFLRSSTKALLGDSQPVLSAEGKNVVVIGGGDTGTDCVATSLRQGCKSVVQLEIMPKPALERTGDNPWPQWPKTFKVDYGQEEAAVLQGEDPRRYSMMTRKFIADEGGNLKALQVSQVEWVKKDGRFIPQPVAGSEESIPAELVLLAMGFAGPEAALAEQLGVACDERSNIKASEKQYLTSRKKVFAAGDARRGQSLVVWAIQEGRGAARECDRFLMGETSLP